MVTLDEDQIARFWSKVDKTPGHGPDGDCWAWTAGKKGAERCPYGGFYLRQMNNTANAHVVSFCLTHNFAVGELPKGIVVRHKCNHPPCVNPAHLLIGTCLDNAQDSVAAGTTRRGTRNSQAKLNEAVVVEIRDLWATGRFTKTELGDRFGVQPSTVWQVLTNRTWKDPNYTPVEFPETNNQHCKFPADVVAKAREMLARGVPVREIVGMTGISTTQVYNLRNNRQRKVG